MITIKSDREIELMREAGYMVSKTHKYLKPFIKEGITTKELDRLAEEYIRSMGGVPTCKGFEGFPATLCTSVNDEVVHGIPSNRKLKKGDIIRLNRAADDKAIVMIDKKELFLAEIGLHRFRKSIKIEKLVRTDKDEVKSALEELEQIRKSKISSFDATQQG